MNGIQEVVSSILSISTTNFKAYFVSLFLYPVTCGDPRFRDALQISPLKRACAINQTFSKNVFTPRYTGRFLALFYCPIHDGSPAPLYRHGDEQIQEESSLRSCPE